MKKFLIFWIDFVYVNWTSSQEPNQVYEQYQFFIRRYSRWSMIIGKSARKSIEPNNYF